MIPSKRKPPELQDYCTGEGAFPDDFDHSMSFERAPPRQRQTGELPNPAFEQWSRPRSNGPAHRGSFPVALSTTPSSAGEDVPRDDVSDARTEPNREHLLTEKWLVVYPSRATPGRTMLSMHLKRRARWQNEDGAWSVSLSCLSCHRYT